MSQSNSTLTVDHPSFTDESLFKKWNNSKDTVNGSNIHLGALYNLNGKRKYSCRRTKIEDVPFIISLINEETKKIFDTENIHNLVENCCYSIVILDPQVSDKIIGHATFEDIPKNCLINMDGKLWKTGTDTRRISPLNSLFFHFFAYDSEHSPERVLAEIFSETFQNCPAISHILLEIPSDFNANQFIINTEIEKIRFENSKISLSTEFILYEKNLFFPPLTIREGREHDLDDLTPLMNIKKDEMERIFNKSYLCDLISMSEKNAQSIVAEYDSVAVGIICISTNIDYSLLNKHFHLEPFHGLYKPHSGDLINVVPVASHISLRKGNFIKDQYADSKSNTILTPPPKEMSPREKYYGENTNSNNSEDSNNKTVLEDDKDKPNLNEDNMMQLSQEEITKNFADRWKFAKKVRETLYKSNGKPMQTRNLSDSSLESASMAEHIVQKSILSYIHKTLVYDDLLPIDTVHEPEPSVYIGFPNAFAIQLCSIDHKFSVRFLDLIIGAFHAFENKEYAILTVPCGTKCPFWFEYFVRVAPKKESTFPRELYVLHKSAITSLKRVRRSTSKDIEKVEDLIETLYEKEKIFNDYIESIREDASKVSFVVDIGNIDNKPIIGLAILSNEPHSGYYKVNYNMDEYTSYDLHEREDHAYVHYFIIHPMFQKFTKIFIKEIMRLTKRHCFYHKIYPYFIQNETTDHQSVLSNLEDWIPLAPRRRINYNFLGLDDIYDDMRIPPKFVLDFKFPNSTIHYAKKFTFEPKTIINDRIVIIGASSTAISFLQSLICAANLSFKNITLISPHGLPGNLPTDKIRDMMIPRKNKSFLSMESDAEYHQRVGLGTWINVVYGYCTKILRNKKVTVVNNQRIVPYDILIIATGMQFTRPDCPQPEIEDENYKNLNKNAPNSKSQKVRVVKSMPINVFTINTEMDAAYALNYLRAFVPFVPKKLIIVEGACLEAYCCINALLKIGINPRRIVFVSCQSDKMEWEKYSGYKETELVRERMSEEMKRLRIRIFKGYKFKCWSISPKTRIAKRIYFISDNEAKSARLSFSCLAYFPFCIKRVGDEIACALTESFILYNNGLIINSNFETSDSSIYGLGPCTLYQKQLQAEEFNHLFFSSEDVGAYLADIILNKIDRSRLPQDITASEKIELAPSFNSPIIRSAQLIGNWHYFYMDKPRYWLSRSVCLSAECKEGCEECPCLTEIITGSVNSMEDPSQKYFAIWFDYTNRVEGMECMSKLAFSPSNLSMLYKVHESLLNKLLSKLENGEVTDMYKFFSQPWISALFHDRWITFKKDLHELYMSQGINEGKEKLYGFLKDYINNLKKEDALIIDGNIIRRLFDSTGLKKEVEEKFLEFLKFNRDVLPMYARLDFVEDLLEERKISPLYQKSKPPWLY